MLLYSIHFSHGTEPTVTVERPNVTIPENVIDVEVCILLSTGISQRAIVTAETGPKTGAADQATGLIMSIIIKSLCLKVET